MEHGEQDTPEAPQTKRGKTGGVPVEIPTVHYFTPTADSLPAWLPHVPTIGIETTPTVLGLLRLAVDLMADAQERVARKLLQYARYKGLDDDRLSLDTMAGQISAVWDFLSTNATPYAAYLATGGTSDGTSTILWHTTRRVLPRNAVPGQPTIVFALDDNATKLRGVISPNQHTPLEWQHPATDAPLPMWLHTQDHSPGLKWLRRREWTPTPTLHMKTIKHPHRLLLLLLRKISIVAVGAPPAAGIVGGPRMVGIINQWKGGSKGPHRNDVAGLLRLLCQFHRTFCCWIIRNDVGKPRTCFSPCTLFNSFG